MKKILSIIAICETCCTAQAHAPRPMPRQWHSMDIAAYYKAERAERRADEARRIATVATVVAVVAVTIGIVQASQYSQGQIRLASF